MIISRIYTFSGKLPVWLGGILRVTMRRTQVYAEMYVRPNVRVHITRDHWCATQQSIFVEQKFLELLTVSYASSLDVIDY